MSDLPQEGRLPRRRRRLRRTLALLGILVLAALAGLVAWNEIDGSQPLAALPPQFDLYASVGSVSATVSRLEGLRAFDELVSDPALAPVRAALAAARGDSFLASPYFRFLADRPARVVVIGSSYLAAADLGVLGCLGRLLPLAGRELRSRGIIYRYADGTSRMQLGSAGQRVGLALRGRLLLASNSTALLDAALHRASSSGTDTASGAQPSSLAERASTEGLGLDPPPSGSIRILLSGERISSALISGDTPGVLLRSGIAFPRDCAVDLSLSNQLISVDALVPISSSDGRIASLLGRRSSVPAILPVLPASTHYLSVLSEGSLEELWAASSGILGPAGQATYARAENACRAALGMDFKQLLYSWAGGELGAFGLAGSEEPVFFLRVADESARRAAFERLFSGAVLGNDDSTVIAGQRISRLHVPWYVKDLMALAGADLPEPYWITAGGFLFVSDSAENLSLVSEVARSGDTLPRAEVYKRLMTGTGADAFALVYYSLDRSLPFFLRGSGPIKRALMLYGTGMLLLRNEGSDGIRVSLRAVSSGEAPSVSELPGFPLAAGDRLAGPPLPAGSGASLALVLPLDDARIVSRPLAGGAAVEQTLDAEAALVGVSAPGGGGPEVWAVTKRGTVYRLGPALAERQPFPVATGYRPTSPPAALPADSAGRRGIAFGVKEGGYLIVRDDGSHEHVQLPGEAALLAPPVFADGWSAVYAKSFDGHIHLFTASGEEAPGWPVPVDGIGYGSPFFVRGSSGLALGFLTQAGQLDLFGLDGKALSGFPIRLDGVFYHAPVTAAGHIYALSSQGTLYHVTPEAGLVGRAAEPGLAAESSYLAAMSLGSGAPLLIGLGGGNRIFAFTLGLEALQGFPVPGALRPTAVDLNGDGSLDLLTAGLDDAIHAYAVRDTP